MTKLNPIFFSFFISLILSV